jgi:hypothetical protein
MTTIIEYQCDICKNKSVSKEYAEKCEARGIPDILPIGCIDGDNTPGSFYSKCIFAIATINKPQGHNRMQGCWGWRDNYSVDNGPRAYGLCNTDNFYHIGVPAKINRETPMFKRMIEDLKKEGITPTIWNGEKAVPLEEREYS